MCAEETTTEIFSKTAKYQGEYREPDSPSNTDKMNLPDTLWPQDKLFCCGVPQLNALGLTQSMQLYIDKCCPCVPSCTLTNAFHVLLLHMADRLVQLHMADCLV